MLTMLDSLSKRYTPKGFVIADTDNLSKCKIEEMDAKDYQLVYINRSREVAQSWTSTIFSTFRASVHSLFILWQHRPDLVMCNGPGTCIPICGATFLLKLCFVLHTRIVFVESICRVKSLSLSGKILYYFADRVLVQW